MRDYFHLVSEDTLLVWGDVRTGDFLHHLYAAYTSVETSDDGYEDMARKTLIARTAFTARVREASCDHIRRLTRNEANEFFAAWRVKRDEFEEAVLSQFL